MNKRDSSLENLSPQITPWHDAETRYQPGQQVPGTVTRITHFGVFVQMEPGLEGVIYTFELGPSPSAADLKPGQTLQLYVKSIDAERKRLELSMEPQHMPGLLAEQALPTAWRHSKLDNEQPAWSMPLPETLLPLSLPTSNASLEHTCPTCQHTTQATWKYCVYCGNTLHCRCSSCGNLQPHIPDARYCYECGQLLT